MSNTCRVSPPCQNPSCQGSDQNFGKTLLGRFLLSPTKILELQPPGQDVLYLGIYVTTGKHCFTVRTKTAQSNSNKNNDSEPDVKDAMKINMDHAVINTRRDLAYKVN